MIFDKENMVLTESEPVSEEEMLLEAQAWGFTTVEDFMKAMEDDYEEQSVK